MCLRVLSEQNALLADVFGEQSRSVFAKMLQVREQEAKIDKQVCSDLKYYGTPTLFTWMPLVLVVQ